MSIIISNMNKLRIYLDTSVIGGYYDEEFKEASQALMKCFERKIYIPIISETVQLELSEAPEKVRNVIKDLKDVEVVDVIEEMRVLSKIYVQERIVTEKYAEDALHIAIATISQVNVLVSWNFKHIVNLDKIHRFNAVNLREGYSLLEIRTPKEVIINEEEI